MALAIPKSSSLTTHPDPTTQFLKARSLEVKVREMFHYKSQPVVFHPLQFCAQDRNAHHTVSNATNIKLIMY